MWLREKSNGTVVKLSKKEYNKFKDTHDMSLYRVHEGNYKNGENVMIAIGGMIGVGKSSLTKLIEERYGATAFYEPVKGNKVLDAFYADKERYGFLLQMNFLFQRFQMVKDAGKLDRQGKTTVLDRTIWEDLYFTQKNNELGNISDIELEVYKNNLNIMMEELDELPKKNADVLIYLHAPFDRILSNIKKRNRGFEQSEADVAYYKTLFDGYDKWYEDYNYGPKFEIDLTHYDLSDPLDAEIIMQKIDSELKRIKEQ